MAPDELLARVLYRDGLMLVIDKPAGLPVHRGPKGGETLEAHLDALRFGLPQPPRLAHRLDRETSGCLVLGRHAKALRLLGRLFAKGAVEKVYWSLVEGAPPQVEGRVELALARRSPERGWWMRVDPAGDPAVTDYRVLARDGDRSFVELRPLTGRTHQLRVHMAALGCPIVGDRIYGRRDASASPALYLHARSVAVPLNPKRGPVRITAPPPPHLHAALDRLGLGELAQASEPAEGRERSHEPGHHLHG